MYIVDILVYYWLFNRHIIMINDHISCNRYCELSILQTKLERLKMYSHIMTICKQNAMLCIL